MPPCRPHNAQSQLARVRAVGLMTGPHGQTHCSHSQWVVGPGRTPQGGAVGCRRAPTPGHPTSRQEAPSCRPGNAQKPARKRVGDGSPRPHPLHPQPAGSGPRTHAPRTGGWPSESAPPRAPHTQARGTPPPAPSCHPHSVQSQLARARSVGLMTGPHAHTPRTHSQRVAGPGHRPERRAVRRGRAPHPGRPTPRQEAPLLGRPRAASITRKASSQEQALWGW